MEALVEELRARTALVARGGGERAVERHRSRGKLLARERIDRLVDPGSAFLELGALAAWEVYDGEAPSAGIVTGIGVVEGRECVIVANDATVKGGSYFPLTVKKHLRAQEIAEQNRLPCLYLVDSGGAYLPLQAEVFPDREHFGRIFFNQARMSSLGDPADRGRDGLVHRRRRLRAGDERRDGDRARHRHDLHRRPAAREGRDRPGRHAPRSSAAPTCTPGAPGVADHYATSDEHALAIARRIVANLHGARPDPPWPIARAGAPGGRSRASCTGSSRTTTARSSIPAQVIARLVDGSRFDEFKALYGETLVCGWARIEGHPVGILANNGVLFAESSRKGAHFIELACKRRVPLVFLQNITGLHGRQGVRDGRHRARRREARQRGRLRGGAEVHRRDRRLVRRRQLRHVRPGLRRRASSGCGRTPASR